MSKKKTAVPVLSATAAEVIGMDLYTGAISRVGAKLDANGLSLIQPHIRSGYVRIVKRLTKPFCGYTHMLSWPGLGLLAATLFEE